jgi:hypothetical protein
VPPYRLAEDGMALVIDRFDLRMDEKYRGSYEISVMKRFGQFANSTHVGEDMGFWHCVACELRIAEHRRWETGS